MPQQPDPRRSQMPRVHSRTTPADAYFRNEGPVLSDEDDADVLNQFSGDASTEDPDALALMDRFFRGRGPRHWQRQDTRIHEDLCEALTDHPAIDARDIEVRVERGEVTLRGDVRNRRMRRLAEETAEHIRGVHHVINDLRYRPSLQGETRPKEHSHYRFE